MRSGDHCRDGGRGRALTATRSSKVSDMSQNGNSLSSGDWHVSIAGVGGGEDTTAAQATDVRIDAATARASTTATAERIAPDVNMVRLLSLFADTGSLKLITNFSPKSASDSKKWVPAFWWGTTSVCYAVVISSGVIEVGNTISILFLYVVVNTRGAQSEHFTIGALCETAIQLYTV